MLQLWSERPPTSLVQTQSSYSSHCNGQGHIVVAYIGPTEGQREGGPALGRCFHYGKRGHRQRECRSAEASGVSQQTAISDDDHLAVYEVSFALGTVHGGEGCTMCVIDLTGPSDRSHMPTSIRCRLSSNVPSRAEPPTPSP